MNPFRNCSLLKRASKISILCISQLPLRLVYSESSIFRIRIFFMKACRKVTSSHWFKACRRLRASRVHVAVPHRPECGAAFPVSVDMAARRIWAVSDDGRRCDSSPCRIFRLAAVDRAPLRQKSLLSLGAVRGSPNRGFCRQRREPEPPRVAPWCRCSSKSIPSSAVLADELQRNREIFQLGKRIWLHPAEG